jgi:hypothetical protein
MEGIEDEDNIKTLSEVEILHWSHLEPGRDAPSLGAKLGKFQGTWGDVGAGGFVSSFSQEACGPSWATANVQHRCPPRDA